MPIVARGVCFPFVVKRVSFRRFRLRVAGGSRARCCAGLVAGLVVSSIGSRLRVAVS